MKHKLFAILILISLCFSASAQKTIAVLTGSNWTFYTDFSTALNQCSAGSTIYLPGGNFTLSQNADTINKQVTIIGVGHYLDSTAATKPTILEGTLYLTTGADNSSFTGFSTVGYGISGISNTTIYNISINRCNTSVACSTFRNVLINECILASVSSSAIISNDVVIQKSVVNSFSSLKDAIIKNSICSNVSYNNGSVQSCLFENCIIQSYYSNGVYYSTFSHNTFFDSTIPNASNNTSINNSFNATLASTFVNVSSTGTFNYNFDFHVLPSSAAHNAGTDGTDLGIYGTSEPYKPSAVPINPHISQRAIAVSSNINGTLPVNIRVIAQDK